MDKEHILLHIVGKGGKRRDVPLPAGVAEQPDPSQQRILRATVS